MITLFITMTLLYIFKVPLYTTQELQTIFVVICVASDLNIISRLFL